MTDYDLLPCSIFISDRSFNITYCNQQFAAEMNRSVNGIIHHKLERLLTNGSKILFQQIVFPSILNQHKISEVQLNFLDSSNNKIPMVVFARWESQSSENIFWCCFAALERNKLLDTLNLSKKQLVESNFQLKALSKTDSLTGCYNRREMLLRLNIIRQQMARRKSSFAVLMLDLDYFKKINDNYGHAEGDNILKQFGQILMSGARFDDVVARYGGKKFIILLPDVDAPGALIAANRIHEGMKDIQSKTSSVTVSIG